MENDIARSSITINATPAQVWEAFTNPDMIKQYLFGTTVHSDWTVGSPITYSGEWEGKPYVDKGVILEIQTEKRLVTSYWSAAFGPETPENHKKVIYEISPAEYGTTVTIIQDGNKTEESKVHSEENWNTVLKKMKELLEK